MGRHIKGVRIVEGVLVVPEEDEPLISNQLPPMPETEWIRFLEKFMVRFLAESRIGPRTCATCGCQTHLRTISRYSSPAVRRSTYARRHTRGHLIPSTMRTERSRAWIPQCGECNTDQADQTLYQWLHVLVGERDERAALVERVLVTLIEMGVHPIDVCGSRARPWGDGGLIDGWLGQLSMPGDPTSQLDAEGACRDPGGSVPAVSSASQDIPGELC